MSKDKFGLYIHIPYCLQRCSYCDFATYVYDQILPPQEYVQLIAQELKFRRELAPKNKLDSIYFGGGTPSLLSANLILYVLEQIAKENLVFNDETEITIEINPATLNTEKIKSLVAGGINRFSVGAQTFKDQLLIAAGRKHSSHDTRQTLDLLQSMGVNYSFDLLFALPHQTRQDLDNDLKVIQQYQPNHLSAYCLTVPSGHPMSFHRPEDDAQAEMFSDISAALSSIGLARYEISNFAKPGFESQHNLLYWRDHDYLGLGLSSHSYIKSLGPWGARFWNPSSIDEYKKMIHQGLPPDFIADLKTRKSIEIIDEKESLFDFCHTALRLDRGLSLVDLENKFSDTCVTAVRKNMMAAQGKNLVKTTNSGWVLTEQGVLLSNKVFEDLADVMSGLH